jgi:hypothetical protein
MGRPARAIHHSPDRLLAVVDPFLPFFLLVLFFVRHPRFEAVKN